MQGPEVLASATAAELIERGALEDELGPVADRPLLAVHLDDEDAAATIAAANPACVVVGVAAAGAELDHPPDLDVLITEQPAPGRPWVHAERGNAAALALFDRAVRASPLAAVTLVQLLRVGPALDVAGALTAESLAYSTLQSGPTFLGWLAARGPRVASASTEPPILFEREGAAATIVLNRPEVRNAFNAAMRDALVEALRLVAADPSIERVDLHGAGPSFCSGGDLAEFGTAPDPATAHLVRTTRSAGLWMHRCRERITAHLHGACVGAGIELPAFAGHVIARPDATFLLPEVGMGLVPGAGGTASVARRVGRQRTAWLAISGMAIDAATALAWGLVDEV